MHREATVMATRTAAIGTAAMSKLQAGEASLEAAQAAKAETDSQLRLATGALAALEAREQVRGTEMAIASDRFGEMQDRVGQTKAIESQMH